MIERNPSDICTSAQAGTVIYIVDDDLSVRTAVARLLRTAGYQVSQYESANQLLENIPPATRGCILLDVQMPGLNGPQLQEALSKMGFELPIIFLTGHGDIPDERTRHQSRRRRFSAQAGVKKSVDSRRLNGP